jgi:hypothetical protein
MWRTLYEWENKTAEVLETDSRRRRKKMLLNDGQNKPTPIISCCHVACEQGRKRSVAMWVNVVATQYKYNQQSAVIKQNSRKCSATGTYIWWNEQDSRCVSIEQSKKKKQTNSNRNMTPNGSSPSRPQVFKKVNGDQSRTLEEKMTHHVGISRLRYRDHGPAPHWTAHKGWATDRPTAPVPTLSHIWHIGLLYLFWTYLLSRVLKLTEMIT